MDPDFDIVLTDTDIVLEVSLPNVADGDFTVVSPDGGNTAGITWEAIGDWTLVDVDAWATDGGSGISGTITSGSLDLLV